MAFGDERAEDVFGLPPSVLTLFAACAFVALVIGIFLSKSPTPAMPHYAGCYRAADAPDIEVRANQLRVLQQPALIVDFTPEYIKGWNLTLSRWIDADREGDGTYRLLAGSSNGEYLPLTHEGEIMGPVPHFDIFDRAGFVVPYQRIADACNR